MARRRDRSNELIAAIVVIGTLALALTFGIILSLSSNSGNTDIQDTPTVIAVVTTPLPTFTPTRTASPTLTTVPTATLIQIIDTPSPVPTVSEPPVIEAFWPDTNVRTGPDTNQPIIGQIQPGSTYPVRGERFRWYLIDFPDSPTGTGWVYSEVVQLSGDPETDSDHHGTVADRRTAGHAHAGTNRNLVAHAGTVIDRDTGRRPRRAAADRAGRRPRSRSNADRHRRRSDHHLLAGAHQHAAADRQTVRHAYACANRHLVAHRRTVGHTNTGTVADRDT